MPTIAEIVARRTDLSTFLVHLTRDHDPADTAKNRLKSILSSGTLKAGSAFGPAIPHFAGGPPPSQYCVCFTETPLEHVHLLAQPIPNRNCQFTLYGVAITKNQGRARGVNPVWYVDITPGHNWLMTPINAAIQATVAAGGPAGTVWESISPFIEQMGTGPKYRKEFWWEREWRHVGDLPLPAYILIFCPEEDHPEFEQLIEDAQLAYKKRWLIDPRWSLEQMIGKLAGFPSQDVKFP